MWISQFCFQNQGKFWFSSHWEERRSLAALNSCSIWALAIALINCWLYLRRFWNIKYQAGFSQMGKFVCSSLWECGNVPVLNCVIQLGWGGQEQESRSCKPVMCKVVIDYISSTEQPLFSLSCLVLHKNHSPQWALGPITFCFVSVINFAYFDDCVDLVEPSGDSTSKGWNFRLKILDRRARIGPAWVLWRGWKGILDF